MTVQEIMIRVFQDSGENTNLLPYTVFGDETTFDLTLPGAQRLLRYINTACVRVANWKFQDGRILRPRSLRGRFAFVVSEPVEYPGSITGAAGTAIATIINNGTVPLNLFVSGSLDNWLLEISAGPGSGQTRFVISSVYDALTDTLTLILDAPFDSAVDFTSSWKTYRSFFKITTNPAETNTSVIALDSTLSLADVMRIRDITNNVDLSRTYRDDTFTSSLKSTGTPSTFQLFGNELWFDAAPIEYVAYELLYIKNPRLLTTATETPELPEIYHEAVALWATHNIMRTNQDFNGAYATKRELEDLMAMLRLQGEFDMEIDSGALTIYG